MNIKNPENHEETVVKTLPVQLFESVENIITNRIYKIVCYSETEFKVIDTGVVEPSPENIFSWNEEGEDPFENIETL